MTMAERGRLIWTGMRAVGVWGLSGRKLAVAKRTVLAVRAVWTDVQGTDVSVGGVLDVLGISTDERQQISRCDG